MVLSPLWARAQQSNYPPNDPQSYPSQDQPAYPTQDPGYSSQQQGYPSQQQGYPSQGQSYPQQTYPSQQGYPPQQNYPPQSYPQQQPGYPRQQPGYPPPGYPAQAYPPGPGWVPPELAIIGQRATFHTDLTFDRSMLQAAQNYLDQQDAQTRSAAAKLDAISLHTYRFSAPGLYDPMLLEQARAEYSALGWNHMVVARGKGDPFDAGQTDLWVNFSHMHATGMVLLLSDPRNLNIVAITGDISPLDLLHLRGHFGIPRFEGDEFVSAPGSPRRGTPAHARSSTAATQPYPAYAQSAPAYSNAPSNGSGTGSGRASKPSAAHPYGEQSGTASDQGIQPAPPPPTPPQH